MIQTGKRLTSSIASDSNPYTSLKHYRVHLRDKLDVGYRLSRSGLAVAYGYKNVTYLGPIIASVSVAADSSKVNVTYSNVASPSIELRNNNGFEVCLLDCCFIIIISASIY